MRTVLLALLTIALLNCGDDKPKPDNRVPGPPAFAPDRATVDQTIDGGAADAR
jgi:hypothetical protein